MSFLNHVKKLVILFGTAIALSMAYLPYLSAQGNSEQYLALIAQYTYGTLQAVNQLPAYLNSWLNPDTSKFTQQIQGTFAALGNLIIGNINFQNNNQLQLTADLFGFTVAQFKNPTQAKTILQTLPNINDLSYSTMVGQPPLPKAPNVAQSPYNYIKNAGGLLLVHTMPGLNWQGPVAAQQKYANYYNTVMSVESFNAYALSALLAEAQNGGAFTTTQQSLITQASGSTWISQIATEGLGTVLRQLLMFESQNYVLMSQLIQTQKQMLTAQTMTNSLLILGNQSSEILLVSKAQGVNPSQ